MRNFQNNRTIHPAQAHRCIHHGCKLKCEGHSDHPSSYLMVLEQKFRGKRLMPDFKKKKVPREDHSTEQIIQNDSKARTNGTASPSPTPGDSRITPKNWPMLVNQAVHESTKAFSPENRKTKHNSSLQNENFSKASKEVKGLLSPKEKTRTNKTDQSLYSKNDRTNIHSNEMLLDKNDSMFARNKEEERERDESPERINRGYKHGGNVAASGEFAAHVFSNKSPESGNEKKQNDQFDTSMRPRALNSSKEAEFTEEKRQNIQKILRSLNGKSSEEMRHSLSSFLTGEIHRFQEKTMDNSTEFERQIDALVQSITQKKCSLISQHSRQTHQTLLQLNSLKGGLISSVIASHESSNEDRTKRNMENALDQFHRLLDQFKVFSIERVNEIEREVIEKLQGVFEFYTSRSERTEGRLGKGRVLGEKKNNRLAVSVDQKLGQAENQLKSSLGSGTSLHADPIGIEFLRGCAGSRNEQKGQVHPNSTGNSQVMRNPVDRTEPVPHNGLIGHPNIYQSHLGFGEVQNLLSDQQHGINQTSPNDIEKKLLMELHHFQGPSSNEARSKQEDIQFQKFPVGLSQFSIRPLSFPFPSPGLPPSPEPSSAHPNYTSFYSNNNFKSDESVSDRQVPKEWPGFHQRPQSSEGPTQPIYSADRFNGISSPLSNSSVFEQWNFMRFEGLNGSPSHRDPDQGHVPLSELGGSNPSFDLMWQRNSPASRNFTIIPSNNL